MGMTATDVAEAQGKGVGNLAHAVDAAISRATAERVEIELGGRTRTLLMDMNALVLIEEAIEKDILNDSSWLDNPKMREVRAITWACLVHDDPSLEDAENGPKLVGSWISLDRLGELLEAIGRAFEAAMPKPVEGDRPKNRAGRRSS